MSMHDENACLPTPGSCHRGPVALLLASGRGSRFDASGRRNKLSETLPDGRTVIGASVAHLLAAGLPVVIVAPTEHRLQHAVGDQPVTWCYNFHPERGMGGSIAAGIGAYPEASAWVVALADMPFIASETIELVVDALSHAKESVAAPYFERQRGHPVAFASTLREKLLGLSGDTGARDLLKALPLRRVAVNDYGILRDIDRPEDLEL